MRPLAALILLALLAGCATPASKDAPDPAELTATSTTAATTMTPVGAFPLTLAPDWVQPGEPFTANANAQGNIDWFLAKPARATSTEGNATEASPPKGSTGLRFGPGHEGGEASHDDDYRPFPAPTLDTGRLTPNTARNVTLAEPGLYRIKSALGESTLIVLPKHSTNAATLPLATPTVIELAPGATLTFHNDRTVADEASLIEFATPLAGTAATLQASTTFQGELEVIARSSQGALGRAPLLVDALKPDKTREYAPMTGTFEVALAQDPNAQPKTHKLPTDYPIELISITLAATSQTTVPPSLRLSFQSPNGTEVASVTGDGGVIEAADLPAGEYLILVHGEQGALVDYEILAIAQLKLEKPVRMTPAEHDGHTSGPINPCDPNPIPPPGHAAARCA